MDRFDELVIGKSEVESLSHQEIGSLMVGFTWRLSLWKEPVRLLQMGCIQVIGAGIIVMLATIPLDRVLNVHNKNSSQRDRSTQLIVANGLVTTTVWAGINGWIFYRGKRLRKLLKLVEKIEEYNQIVRSIETLVQVTSLTSKNIESAHIETVLEILRQTRHHLITGLEVDAYLRQHQSSSFVTNNLVELAPDAIAQNLISLQSLANQPQLAEYATLLDRAWEIGISIEGEISTTQH